MKRFALLIAAMVLVSGCFEPAQSVAGEVSAGQQQPAAISGVAAVGAEIELGRRIYNFRCYYCHGYSGNARTLAATLLNPKPLDFTSASPDSLTREQMLQSIQSGRPGTAMMSFADTLQPNEIAAVTDFVRQEFMVAKAENTRYHTAANGWPNHERYAAAFPFATGKLPLDTPWEQLTQQQADGKRLFMTSCVTCHDHARVDQKGIRWEVNSSSNVDNSPVDAMTDAGTHFSHNRQPVLYGLTAQERRGETLYQKNCAICHAADGTAHNWIGSFMQPHPPDLTNPTAMAGMTKTRLRKVIRDGLPGTSMSAWKSVLSEQEVNAIIAYVGHAFHPLSISP